MEKLYNYNYTRDPGYYDLITGVFNAVIWRFRAENMKDYSFPRDFFRDFSREFVFPLAESYPILYIAIIFTIVRYLFEYLVCKVSSMTDFLKIGILNFIKEIFFEIKSPSAII